MDHAGAAAGGWGRADPAAPGVEPPSSRSGHGSGQALNAADPVEDMLDEIEAEALAEWEEQMEPVLGPLRDLVDGAESYDDLTAKLSAALGSMDTAALALTLAKAMFKARGAGDVQGS